MHLNSKLSIPVNQLSIYFKAMLIGKQLFGIHQALFSFYYQYYQYNIENPRILTVLVEHSSKALYNMGDGFSQNL